MRHTFHQICTSVSRFARDEEAASAVEYGLLASLIAAVIITILGTLGGNLKNAFTKVSNGVAGH